jgi:bacteriocin-like protein
MELIMEKQKRVLAYTLAQTMDNEELAKISGGSNQQATLRRTFRITGIHGPDGEYDVTEDY